MADKKDLIFYLNDINSYIKEIKESGLNILDEESFNSYLTLLKEYKRRWKEDVLPVDKGPNIVSKSLIIFPIEETIFKFRKFMKNIGKQKLRDKNSNELLSMFESLLNKDNASEEEYKSSITTMYALYEHFNKDSSKYNEINEDIAKYIYTLVKRRFLENEDAFHNISSLIKVPVCNIIKPMIIEDAKSILIENFDIDEKKDIQNDIRIFLTLNDFVSYNCYEKLFEKIINLNRIGAKKAIVEDEIEVENLDDFYEEILNELDEIKKDNYGLYTYSLIYIYYAKKEAIDNQEFILALKEVKKELITYNFNEENKYIDSDKQKLINKINDSEDNIRESILDNFNFKSKFDRFTFLKYINFENYKKKMLNGNYQLTTSDYIDTKEMALLFSKFIISGYFEDSIITEYNKSEILNVLSELIESEEDSITIWKINSYNRLLFDKRPHYINILSSKYVNASDLTCKIDFYSNKNIDTVNKFYSNMIILYPILPMEEFEKQFKDQLIDCLNILKTDESNSFAPSGRTIKLQLKKINDNLNYNLYQSIMNPENELKPYYIDFKKIYTVLENRKSPLKPVVRIKELKRSEANNALNQSK